MEQLTEAHMGNARRLCTAVLTIGGCLGAIASCGTETTPATVSVEVPTVPEILEIVERVSPDSILASLRQFESLGVKSPGSQAIVETREWLRDKYRSYGYSDITLHEFDYETHRLQNIVVNKTGATQPDRFLIIDGHYDTVGGPGVNDNGSGVAIILEVARVLADIDCDVSIRFINFSAEEEGLVGSTAYVEDIVAPQDLDILLVLNIDEVGGAADTTNSMITCERDEGSLDQNNAASAAYTDTIAALTHTYSSLETQIAHAYGSDYLPFEREGYVITGFYETLESSHIHSPNDVLANMNPGYVTQIARATVAAALHFAGADLEQHDR